MLDCIGSGAFGNVYRGKCRLTGCDCAIKAIPREKLTPRILSYLDREIKILRSLSHENIARLLDVQSTEDYTYLVFELYNGGDLSKFVKKRTGRLDEPLVRHIVRQIVRAMNVLNRQSIIHRDIKLANVFLHYPTREATDRGLPVVKLGDFGFARELSVGEMVVPPETDLAMSHVGTPINMAPEIIHDQPYSFKADIWSLGTITYELLCGHPCFNGLTKCELFQNVEKGIYKVPKSIRPSKECIDFLSSCLVEDTAKRITWEQVMVHPFLIDGTRSELIPQQMEERVEGNQSVYVLSTKIDPESYMSQSLQQRAANALDKFNNNPLYGIIFEDAEYGFVKVDTRPETIKKIDCGFIVV